MDKLVVDGCVAVILSTEYGAAWYSWCREFPGLAFDGEMAKAILDGDEDLATVLVEEKYPEAGMGYCGYGLGVRWIKQGTKFHIYEWRDGIEEIAYEGDPHFVNLSRDFEPLVA